MESLALFMVCRHLSEASAEDRQPSVFLERLCEEKTFLLFVSGVHGPSRQQSGMSLRLAADSSDGWGIGAGKVPPGW